MQMVPARRDVTIGDVAAHAKVSRAQAARAIGGYGAVSDVVRDRVLAAAEELDYRSNSLARSFSTGRSQSVGVVVGDIENPYFALSVRGISDTLRAAGYDVILMNTGESHALEVDAIHALDRKRVDGFLVAPAFAPSVPHLQGLVDAGRPLVLFDRDAPELAVRAVVVDVEAATRELVEVMIETGHRRFGYVSTLPGPPMDWGADPQIAHTPVGRRLGALSSALREQYLDLNAEDVRMGARDTRDIRRHVRELVTGEHPVTVLLASDAVIAVAALEELRDLGLSVPRDVSLAVFDDPPWAGLVSPPLTVVSQPVLETGNVAARLLLDAMSGRARTELPELSAHLIRRDSIGPVPGERTAP